MRGWIVSWVISSKTSASCEPANSGNLQQMPITLHGARQWGQGPLEDIRPSNHILEVSFRPVAYWMSFCSSGSVHPVLICTKEQITVLLISCSFYGNIQLEYLPSCHAIETVQGETANFCQLHLLICHLGEVVSANNDISQTQNYWKTSQKRWGEKY